MPLTRFQQEVSGLLAVNRAPDSYLAGGAAIHMRPNSKRYSNDLDFFGRGLGKPARILPNGRPFDPESLGYNVLMDYSPTLAAKA